MTTVAYVPTTVQQMQTTIQEMKSSLPEELQYLFTQRADEIARETKFVQRTSPLTGSVFAQALIFSFLGRPDSSYTTLQDHVALQGVSVTAQALEKRMTPRAADFLFALLRACAHYVLQEPDPVAVELYDRFDGIFVQDGTVIGLPDCLKTMWKGFGGRAGASGSALQIQVRLNLSTGELAGPWLADGCACERSGESSLQQHPLPARALRMTDAGFLTASLIDQLNQPDQPYFLSGPNANWKVRTQRDGAAVDLPTFLEQLETDTFDGWVWLTDKQVRTRLIVSRLPEALLSKREARAGGNTSRRAKGSKRVQVGKKQGLSCIYVSKRIKTGQKTRRTLGWSLLLTNVPQEMLSGHEARVLFRARWQIELLWKLWKQVGELDTWRSVQPSRILCEVYAKLIGLLIQHWLIRMGCWSNPHRSMVKASEAIRLLAPCLLLALQGPWTLEKIINLIPFVLQHCSVNTRRNRPSTSHILEQVLQK
jgi:hypothetical protein